MAINEDVQNPGTYIVRYAKRHPITKAPRSLTRKGVRSLAEARRVYNELVLELDRKLRETVVPSWWAALGMFPDFSRSRYLTEKTISNYLVNLKAYTFECWADRPVDTFTADEIRELVMSKTSSKSVAQQKNLLKFIRAVFAMCLEKGFIKHNPTPLMKFRSGDKIKKVLTYEQVRAFLAKARELNVEWYPHWAMALYTGMRSGELVALTWDNVNLDNRTIVVSQSWNSKDGFKSTKSGNDRLIGISECLVPLLKELKLSGHDPEFVLPRLPKWMKGEQARELRMFLLGMGLPPVKFHDLRATWATLLLSKGVVPIQVMKMGGWEDMKTMMIYSRKAGVDIRGAADVLDFHDPAARYGTVSQLRPELSL